jgi:hypothetical protein
MDIVGQKFNSYAEAEEAEKAYMLSLTADQRIVIAKKIIASVHPNIDELPDMREYHRLSGQPAFILKGHS